MLAFGGDLQYFIPGACIQFLRMGGTEFPGPVLDEARCTGPVSTQLEQLVGKLDSHNRTAVDIASGPIEKRRLTHSAAALRQIAYNAVMHRTYEATNAPVRVTWYDDRVEIISPGGAYGVVTAENFGQPGAADYRNPSLAESMRVLGIVQRFGVGIGIARTALRRNLQPEPFFDVQPNWVRCVVRARPGEDRATG